MVTADDLKVNWGCRGRYGLACGMCDRLLEEGDIARWQLMRGACNTFVCEECDGPDLAEQFKDRWDNTIMPILRRWGHT